MTGKDKERKLTEDEIRRLGIFEDLAAGMEQDGYKMTPLTIDMKKASIFSFVLFIIAAVIFGALFIAVNGFDFDMTTTDITVFTVAVLILTVVHELVHGATWAVFAEDHFRDISFGFMKEYLAPYCSCKTPLSKGQYITGALMPLIVTGIVPAVIALITGSWMLLLIGVALISGAAGDILIVRNILRYRTSSADVRYIDHPTEGGGVIFEKD